jgi:hypothetical protein
MRIFMQSASTPRLQPRYQRLPQSTIRLKYECEFFDLEAQFVASSLQKCANIEAFVFLTEKGFVASAQASICQSVSDAVLSAFGRLRCIVRNAQTIPLLQSICKLDTIEISSLRIEAFPHHSADLPFSFPTLHTLDIWRGNEIGDWVGSANTLRMFSTWKIPSLQSVTLPHCHIEATKDALLDFLLVHGKNLTYLDLDRTHLDIHAIISHCPLLHQMIFSRRSFPSSTAVLSTIDTLGIYVDLSAVSEVLEDGTDILIRVLQQSLSIQDSKFAWITLLDFNDVPLTESVLRSQAYFNHWERLIDDSEKKGIYLDRGNFQVYIPPKWYGKYDLVSYRDIDKAEEGSERVQDLDG